MGKKIQLEWIPGQYKWHCPKNPKVIAPSEKCGDCASYDINGNQCVYPGEIKSASCDRRE